MRKGLCEISNPKQWKTISTEMLTPNGYPVYGANGIIGYFSDYNHTEETLLITCRGATCGSLNICEPYSYVNGNAMAIDNLSEEVDLKYLYYYLLNRGLDDVITGSAQPQIVRQSLTKVYVEYPELKEQKEIVSSLNKVEQLIFLRKRQLSKLDELVKSRFIEMFDCPCYPQVTIGELVTAKVPSVKKAFAPTDVIKYIDISSIDNIRNVMTGYTEYVLQEAPSRAQQHIQKGDIVISTVRPNLKNVAITTYEDENLVASSGFCVLRATKCLPSYLMAIVCSEKFTESMVKLVTGANYPAIKDSDVLNYVVAFPPIEVQDEFAAFVEQIDKSKFEIQKSLEQLEILKKSLMQKYFG